MASPELIMLCIATQTKVEQSLQNEGKTRADLGRRNFLEHAKMWRDKHGGIILEQLKKLSCSVIVKKCSYSRRGLLKICYFSLRKTLQKGYIYKFEWSTGA